MNAALLASFLAISVPILADSQEPGGDPGPAESAVSFVKMGGVDFTFTPTIGGALTRIELLRSSGSAGDITATVGDGLASSVLTVDLHNPSEREPEWVGWDFSGVEVAQGEAYRVTLAKDPTVRHMSWGWEYWTQGEDVQNVWRPAFRVWVEQAIVPVPGDADGSGSVDLADFAILKQNFGRQGAWVDGDFTGDGRVDLYDFGILKDNFGRTAQAAVPEPRGVELAMFAALVLGIVATVGRSRARIFLAIAIAATLAPSTVVAGPILDAIQIPGFGPGVGKTHRYVDTLLYDEPFAQTRFESE